MPLLSGGRPPCVAVVRSATVVLLSSFTADIARDMCTLICDWLHTYPCVAVGLFLYNVKLCNDETQMCLSSRELVSSEIF